jgi:hypothetical protein
MMRSTDSILSFLWKVPLAGLAWALGAVLGGMLCDLLGVAMPRSPAEIDPTLQGLLLLPGGLAFALGLAAIARGLTGRLWERWLALAAFLFVINGVGNALEASIFTTLGGTLGGVLVNLPSSVLAALVVAVLVPAASNRSLGESLVDFVARRPGTIPFPRLGLAIVAFPFVYFLFGIIVAPIVSPHYAELDYLSIPPLPTILSTVFVRSVLLLAVSLPIMAGWCRSRRRLIVALGLGHSTAVGLGGLIQSPFFPAILRWVHGVEILADSFVYAWILVALLVPWGRAGADLASEDRPRTAPSPLSP